MLRPDYAALAVAGLILATMPAYAVVRRGRPVDPEVAKRPATVLLGRWIRDWLMWTIAPLERGVVRTGLSPDLFNVAGAALGLAAGIAYGESLLWLAGWCVLLGGLMDIFDGRIARARGIVNARGAFLDSTLDRFSETFAFVGLALYFSGRAWAILATTLALGGSLLVSYARARGEALNVSCKGGLMQRAERLVLLALASLLDAPVTRLAGWRPGVVLAAVVTVIALGSLGTAVFRTVAIARALDRQDAL